MKNAFKAGSAYIELFASKKKLKSDLSSVGRDLDKKMGKLGKKSGDKYAKGFDGMAVGKKIGNGLKRGIEVGGKGLKAALLGGTAIAGVGLAAGAAFATITKTALGAAREVQQLADVSGITAERFQEIAFGAKQFGIDGQEVADVLKDMNDRLGDFAQTNAGPLADFFENIAPKVGLTIDSFRELSSDQALGLYVKALEDAGVNQQDMTFYMEALAGNSTKLLPLLKNNGAAMNDLSKEARELGLVLENDAVRQAAEADKKLEKLGSTIRSGLTGAIIELAPEIQDLTDDLIELVPTLVGWAENVVTGLVRAGEMIGWLGDQWNASPFGDGSKANDPKTLKQVHERIQEINSLSRNFDAFNSGELGLLEGNKHRKRMNTLGVKVFGEEEYQQLKKDGNVFRAALTEEYRRIYDLQDKFKKPKPVDDQYDYFAENDPDFEQNRAEYEANDPTFGSSKKRKRSSSSTPENATSRAARLKKENADLKKAQQEQARILREKADTARDLLEAAQTPFESYTARLAELLAFESDALIADAAGGPETFSRLRVQALQEVTDATGDYQGAIDELVNMQNAGVINAKDFGQAFVGLAIELDDTAGALGRLTNLSQGGFLDPAAVTEAREAIRQSGEYAKDINNEKIQTLELQAEELAYELHLAQLRGNIADTAALERRLAITRETIELMRQGVKEDRATRDAETFVEQQDFAAFEGEARDAFKGAFRAAVDGDLGDYLSNKLSSAADNMFDNALDNVFDALTGKDGILAGLFGGGESGGGLLSGLFGGGDKDGGLGGLFGGLFGKGSSTDDALGGFTDGLADAQGGLGGFGDALGSVLGGGGGLGGGLGGLLGGFLGKTFAGFFADGGNIGSGQFGIVGEGGGMKHAELVTGPATVTPLKALQNAVGQGPSVANLNGGNRTTVQNSYNISGIMDVAEMKKFITDQDAKTLNEVPSVMTKVQGRNRRASPR